MLMTDINGHTLAHAALKGFIPAERSDETSPVLVGTVPDVLKNMLKEIRQRVKENVEPDLAALRSLRCIKVNDAMRDSTEVMITILEAQARLEYCAEPTTGRMSSRKSPARFLLESRPYEVNGDSNPTYVFECLQYFAEIDGMVFEKLDSNPSLLMDKSRRGRI